MQGRHQHQGAAGLDRGEHVDQPVLDDLEAGNRHVKLFARADVFASFAQQRAHGTQGVGAGGNNAKINQVLKQPQALAFRAQQCVGPEHDLFEYQITGATAVVGPVARHLHARRFGTH